VHIYGVPYPAGARRPGHERNVYARHDHRPAQAGDAEPAGSGRADAAVPATLNWGAGSAPRTVHGRNAEQSGPHSGPYKTTCFDRSGRRRRTHVL